MSRLNIKVVDMDVPMQETARKVKFDLNSILNSQFSKLLKTLKKNDLLQIR